MKKWPAFSRRPFFIRSYALTHELEALFGQFGTDLFDLGRVAGLQRQLEESAVSSQAFWKSASFFVSDEYTPDIVLMIAL